MRVKLLCKPLSVVWETGFELLTTLRDELHRVCNMYSAIFLAITVTLQVTRKMDHYVTVPQADSTILLCIGDQANWNELYSTSKGKVYSPCKVITTYIILLTYEKFQLVLIKRPFQIGSW